MNDIFSYVYDDIPLALFVALMSISCYNLSYRLYRHWRIGNWSKEYTMISAVISRGLFLVFFIVATLSPFSIEVELATMRMGFLIFMVIEVINQWTDRIINKNTDHHVKREEK